MSVEPDPGGRTPTELRAARRYMWGIAMSSFAFLLLFLVLPSLVNAKDGSALSIVVALAPMLAVIWMLVSVFRLVRRVDEFQRGMILSSFAIGFATAMLIALTIAFLRPVGIVNEYTEWWVFIGGMSSWGVALTLFSMRANR